MLSARNSPIELFLKLARGSWILRLTGGEQLYRGHVFPILQRRDACFGLAVIALPFKYPLGEQDSSIGVRLQGSDSVVVAVDPWLLTVIEI